MQFEIEFRGPRIPRTALVHDWLVTYGGAEGVLAEMTRLLPNAPVHVLVDFFEEAQRNRLKASRVIPSFIQQLPRARRLYWYYAALMPLAVERFDLREFDLVISSSHAFAKGVLAQPDQLHVSYVHSPLRFAWDLQQYYLERFGWLSGAKQWAALCAFHYLRLWDVRTNNGVDLMLCNSDYVRRRILKVHRRHAYVVHPPIDTELFAFQERKSDFYITGSFMNPFKRIDLVVQAFAEMPTRRLVVFGTGPDLDHCRRLAGPNIEFVGSLSNEQLVAYLQAARAFVFGAPEDFGMLMAEAQACGTPVLAYAKGGALEIVRDLDHHQPTGAMFSEQTPASVRECVLRFEGSSTISPESCRINALRFAASTFRARMQHILAVSWEHWASGKWPLREERLFPCFNGSGDDASTF